MFYTYVFKSLKNDKLYTGCTKDLRKRFDLHNKGRSSYTKEDGPWKLIYYEACVNESDAYAREKYLKSGMGKRYVKNRLKRFLSLTGYMMVDILKWFLLFFLGLFLLWVFTGGPERAEQKDLKPIISAPTGVGSPSFTPSTAN